MKFCPKCQATYQSVQTFCNEDGAILSLRDIFGINGQVVAGKYQIEALIGMGGMSAVYSAQQIGVGRRVAFKMLLPHLAANNDRMVNFFEREARTVGQLFHENIATVFDAGRTADDTAYMAMEWLDGHTLDEELQRLGKLSLERVRWILRQVAAALQAAHAKYIIHRDLKPSNIMVVRRTDGQEVVKVLDFGLAKLSNENNDLVSHAVGTPHYASPEQFQLGSEIDSRTDIYALGVMLFQLLTGRLPFDGSSVHEVIRLHMIELPPTLTEFCPDAPVALENLIHRMMAKNPHYRPQTAQEVLTAFELALDSVGELPTESGIYRWPSQFPELNPNSAEAKPVPLTVSLAAGLRQEGGAPRQVRLATPPDQVTTEDAQHIKAEALPQAPFAQNPQTVGSPMTPSLVLAAGQEGFTPEAFVPGGQAARVKRRWWPKLLWATLLVFVVGWGVKGGLGYFSRGAVLKETDTVLLANFINNTNEPVFNGALHQALVVQLAQTPFLYLLPEDRIRETLRYMGKKVDEKLTREVAREVAQRQGGKAVITGQIDQLGNHYSILLEAINAQSGESFARTLVEAESKEAVLKALGQATMQLRAKLGESLSTIQKFNKPIEFATTSSLEALNAYSLGRDQNTFKGKTHEALALYKRATEIDPNFALAYIGQATIYNSLGQFELAAVAATEAMKRANQSSEQEKLTIMSFHYLINTLELEKAIEILKVATQTYTRRIGSHNNLSACYGRLGLFEEGLAEANEALAIDARNSVAHTNRSELLIRLGRFDEARVALEQALKQGLDRTAYHENLFELAFLRGDQQAMQEQVDWLQGKPEEFRRFRWQARAAVAQGKLHEATSSMQQAIELLKGDKRQLELVATLVIANSAWLSLVGLEDEARPLLKEAWSNAPTAFTRLTTNNDAPYGVLALALSGATEESQAVIARINQTLPHSTLANAVWIPTAKAVFALRKKQPQQALEYLQSASTYERSSVFFVNYLRGLTYLELKRGQEAAQEFQKILANRGYDICSPIYPLAKLGVARAYRMVGDVQQSRRFYAEFLQDWRQADSRLTVLQDANREFAQLSK